MGYIIFIFKRVFNLNFKASQLNKKKNSIWKNKAQKGEDKKIILHTVYKFFKTILTDLTDICKISNLKYIHAEIFTQYEYN